MKKITGLVDAPFTPMKPNGDRQYGIAPGAFFVQHYAAVPCEATVKAGLYGHAVPMLVRIRIGEQQNIWFPMPG